MKTLKKSYANFTMAKDDEERLHMHYIAGASLMPVNATFSITDGHIEQTKVMLTTPH